MIICHLIETSATDRGYGMNGGGSMSPSILRIGGEMVGVGNRLAAQGDISQAHGMGVACKLDLGAIRGQGALAYLQVAVIHLGKRALVGGKLAGAPGADGTGEESLG